MFHCRPYLLLPWSFLLEDELTPAGRQSGLREVRRPEMPWSHWVSLLRNMCLPLQFPHSGFSLICDLLVKISPWDLLSIVEKYGKSKCSDPWVRIMTVSLMNDTNQQKLFSKDSVIGYPYHFRRSHLLRMQCIVDVSIVQLKYFPSCYSWQFDEAEPVLVLYLKFAWCKLTSWILMWSYVDLNYLIMLLFVMFYFMFALVNLMLTKYLYKQSCFHFVKKNERNKLKHLLTHPSLFITFFYLQP